MRHLDPESLAADRTHVFPAEIAAAFWRRELVQSTDRRAVREDRIISWDTFKEAVFADRSNRRPANRTARRLFARWLAEENARSPFLSALIAPAHAAHSTLFVGKIEQLLPPLHQLRSRYSEKLDAASRNDIEEIYQRYAAYLRRAERFEPSWQQIERSERVGKYTIHFPEVIEDYPEFVRAIDKIPTLSERRIPKSAIPALLEFGNAHEEVAWLLGRLEELLDGGVRPERIAVTVGNTESYLPYLAAEAGRREIPLAPRAGKVLSAYPGGRFFSLLRDLVADDFSLHAMKSLLLNGAIPIRDREAAREIVRCGIDSGVVRSSVSGRRDEWEQALRGRIALLDERDRQEEAERRERTERALELYRSLARGTNDLVNAGTFAELRRRLYRLFAVLLDTDAWDHTNVLVFQRCMEVLTDCIEESRADGYAVSSPFTAWLTLIDSQIYVPRGAEEGIPVYPYRVAAGIAPDYHFVVNCSNEAARVLSVQWSFLREDQRESLGLHGAEMTDGFLTLYALSGSEVLFSYARESFSGPQIAPFTFVGDGTVLPAETGAGEPAAEDPFEREPSLWSGASGEIPDTLYPVQRAGARYIAQTGLLHRAPDYGAGRVTETDLRNALVARCGREKPGRVLLSATDLQRYVACPFSYLLMRPLAIDDEYYQVDQDDPRLLGTLYHDVLEHLFGTIRDEDGVLRSDRLDRYQEILREVLGAVSDGRLMNARRLLPPARHAVAYRLEGAVDALLREEVTAHDRYQILKAESWHRTKLADPVVELVGRIDRLLRNPESGELVLVDYKRKNLPKKRDLGIADPADTLTAMQLPMYSLLLEENGATVERVLYCSIENGTWHRVYDGGEFPGWRSWHSGESWSAAVGEVRERIAAVSQGIREGDFRFPDPEHGCESCVFRGICRTKFRVR